ncbi:MAG: GldG family protein [Elusimicrobiaceae bacterium]|nr:GldG family protein [Elusimicrobiaceae bacterium]
MKRNRLFLNVTAAALLATGIFAAANLLSYNLNFRADLTRGGIYSVNPATRKLVSALPAPVVITLYVSRELPGEVAAINDYLRNILRDYEAIGSGRIKVRIVETGNDDSVAKEAVARGVVPVVFDIFAKEKYEQRNGFFGLTIQYKDKTECIPFISNADNLEYDITSRINALVNGIAKRIGFITAGGAKSLESLDPEFVSLLRTQFELTEVGLEPGSKELPDALILLSPSRKFSAAQLYALDRYVSGGGSLFCALDRLDVNLRGFVAVPVEPTGIEDLLAHYGLEVSSALVMDRQSQPMEVARKNNGAVLRNIVQYYPLVSAGSLDRLFPPVAALDFLFLPFVSPVSVTAKDGISTIIARSSPNSWSRPLAAGVASGTRDTPGAFAELNIGPFTDFIKGVPARPDGPYALAVCLQRIFPPYFSAPPKGVVPAPPAPPGQGRIIVVGTSRFVVSDFRMPDSNYIFFMNCAEWLALDPSLIAIRSKATDFAPLDELSASGKAMVKYANILLPPLLAVLAGLAVWRFNLRRRAGNVRKFGSGRK